MKLDIAFDAPGRTLFLLDSLHLRILPFAPSTEARLPVSDFLALLYHLVLHQASALVILQIPQGLLEHLLSALTAATKKEAENDG
ncbi:MAG TPA: hypothetical protein VF173_02845 [Thermoanaerobaculia bacterium]|nr:hypothetical protein [Thermoanaerobaculia bacterium]